MSVPFEERGGWVRGCLDLMSGRYPRFLFGGRVGADLLPVFHFHDVTPDDLEPKLRYLSENGYRTVVADDVAAYARRQRRFTEPRVALCFDDAWTSLWTVAAPLLERYGLTAITYAIPARMQDAPACRPLNANAEVPGTDSLFVTWPELRALQDSGVVDVQCHTETHSMVFCSTRITGFVTPEYSRVPLLNRPQISPPPALRFLGPEALGAPIYESRSRMSDARRIAVPADRQKRAIEYVAREGGPAFFSHAGWEAKLRELAPTVGDDSVESEADRNHAIDAELEQGRAILNERLRTNTVRHICLPWGVSSPYTATALKRVGYDSAIANRMPGVLAVRPGDDPYWLKRLPNRYIFRLPGRGRRIWT